VIDNHEVPLRIAVNGFNNMGLPPRQQTVITRPLLPEGLSFYEAGKNPGGLVLN
jgi:hypothetical protein